MAAAAICLALPIAEPDSGAQPRPVCPSEPFDGCGGDPLEMSAPPSGWGIPVTWHFAARAFQPCQAIAMP